jgi:KDO2-lipid IV(A) lauroyltransferase
LAFNGVEMLRAGRITRAWIAARSNSDVAMQRIASLCGSGRGGIVAGPHMGNWELAGVTMRLHDLPIFTIAARQKNPLTDRYLNALRTTFGIPAVMRGSGTMKDVLRKLKAGMLLAILPDLRAAEHGILIPFLGGQASIAPGMALFARHAEIPIFLTLVRRIGWTSHSLEVLDPVYPDKSLDKDEDVRRMTGLIMRNIEKAILDDPAQWFWFNKRWILDPV